MQYIRLYLQNGKTSAKNFRHVALCKQKTSPRNPGTRINTRFFEERETGIEPATPTLARLNGTIPSYIIVPQTRINTAFLRNMIYQNISK